MRASVLVVDDDPIQRALVCEALSGQPYDCSEAPDGVAALAQLIRAPADLVIVDMLMPRKDGIETIVAIRTRWPATRIIAISGGSPSLTPGYLLDTAKAVGADACLRKPIARADLISLAEELLADGAAERGRD